MFLKIVHKGFPSNCQIYKQDVRLRNTLINGGNLQQAEFNTQDSCNNASTTGYRVYWLVLATQPCTLASTTGYRVYRLVLATQSCTLALTYRLQSLLTGCWLHSPYCTVLHPNWLHNKKKSWLNVAQEPSKFIGDPSLPVFLCRLQRFTVYSKLPVMESWYWTELPQCNLVTENS